MQKLLSLSQINDLIPMPVKDVMHCIMRCGGEVYIVGGAVRLLLTDQPVTDWDIATSLKPDEVESIFSHMPTALTGKKFGTVGIIYDGIPVEITTFRLETGYVDFRHPDYIEFVKDIVLDLSRRDFTINALAYNPFINEPLVDPFNGLQHLSDSAIKTVGNAFKKFLEDPLRLIRCARLSAELNYSIDHDTFDALCKMSCLLCLVSKERIRIEFDKILLSQNASDGLRMLYQSKLLKYILPVLYFDCSCKKIANISIVLGISDKDLIFRLAALFFYMRHDIDNIENMLKKLRYDSKTIKNVIKLLSNAKLTCFKADSDLKYNVRKLLSSAGEIDALKILNLMYCFHELRLDDKHAQTEGVLNGSNESINTLDALDEGRSLMNELKRDPLRISDLAICGRDLIESGICKTNDKATGKMLSQALDWVLHNPELNDKNTLLSKILSELKNPSE